MNFIWPEEFIQSDQRNQKKTTHQSHEICQEFFYYQHTLALDKKFLENCSVLDLGSYLGTTAYYCLKNNCKDYFGVELLEDQLNQSKKFISQHIDSKNWIFHQAEIQDFILSTDKKFDVIIAWGVFNSFTDPILMLEKLCQIGNTITIESPIPNILCDNDLDDIKSAIVEINPYSCQLQAHTNNPIQFQGSRISIGAIKLVANRYGFNISIDAYDKLKELYPNTYGIKSEARRSLVVLNKDNSITKPLTYREIYT